MDERTSRSFARNGEELHPQQVVLQTGSVVACLDDGPSKRCPYGLGAACPLIEIGKRVVRKRWWIAHGVGLALGLAISALMVWLVYY